VEFRTLLAVILAVLPRPSLWWVAARQAIRLAPTRWWSTPPHLPVPPEDYIRFRMVTAYGGDGSAPPTQVARDVVSYLEWCRTWP